MELPRRAYVRTSAEVDQLAHDVIGAAIEVHRYLGPGYLESVYENALAVEFRMAGIPFENQSPLSLTYKDNAVGEARLDFLVGSNNHQLVVELKAVEKIADIHRAQVISDLKATQLPLGLLINFNVRLLKNGIERIVFTKN